jgi:hypothetical protein
MSDSVDFSVGDEEGAAIVSRSLADRIKAQIAARKARVLVFTHPDCPEWTVTYRLPLDRAELAPYFDRAEKAAKRKARYNFDAAVLAAYNVGLSNMGEEVTDESGTALTVRDRAVMALLDATSPSEAIRALYGSDGITSAIAEKLMAEAGYGTGDDVMVDDAPDPTNAG